MNIRHSKLATKQLYKIRDKYYNEDYYINKGSDYEITDPPKQHKQTSLFQTIENLIYADPTSCQWHDPPIITDWIPPNPIFT